MTTMYKTITAERTAEGATLDFYTLFDLFGNDWSVLAGCQGVALPQDSIPSATTPAWVDMQKFWIELPVYAVDARFDDLEIVLALRVFSHGDSQTDCDIRLVNAAESVLGASISVTETSSTLQEYMELVWPAASIPTGRVEVKVQGRWNSDPGSKTLFVERSTALTSDAEFFIRVAT